MHLRSCSWIPIESLRPLKLYRILQVPNGQILKGVRACWWWKRGGWGNCTAVVLGGGGWEGPPTGHGFLELSAKGKTRPYSWVRLVFIYCLAYANLRTAAACTSHLHLKCVVWYQRLSLVLVCRRELFSPHLCSQAHQDGLLGFRSILCCDRMACHHSLRVLPNSTTWSHH